MNLENLKHIYLLGAGGIGMSALGRYFIRKGISVYGYDKTPTRFTDDLIAEGFQLNFTDNPDLIPAQIKSSSSGDVLVIYTPAIPENNQQIQFFRNQGFNLLRRAEVLGLISSSHKTIAVAGTHGKTTTSAMIAHILQSAGMSPIAFLGGIAANYNTNYLSGGVNSILVAEADEYDRSFLHLHPDTTVITSVDADHLDIYGNQNELLNSFSEFMHNTKPAGQIILKAGIELFNKDSRKIFTYHTSKNADIQLLDCKEQNGFYFFDVKYFNQTIKDLTLGQPGFHNVENALAAIGAVMLNGISVASLRSGLASFKGVKRRFEYIIRSVERIFIDDYAHHPEELKACIGSVRSLYPGKKITGVFQPHLFTRTRDFYDDFAQSLSMLDQVILLDIYPAREKPIEGVSSSVLLEKIKISSKTLCEKKDLTHLIEQQNPEVLLTLGAGDIDQLVDPIRNCLMKKSLKG